MDNIWLEYIIETGLIVNAIVYNEESTYFPPDGLSIVKRENCDAWIGWVYDGENFIPPEEPEEIVE